jgi:hypothetical protein
MAPRFLSTFIAILAWAVLGTAAAQAQTSSEPAKPPGASLADVPAIEFYLARGDADACGPGCNEWIAAEGRIDAGAAQRLRRLLAKLGRRRPPIYFESPGGLITGALELGRLIREQKLEASVAHTVPVGCESDKLFEKSCLAQKRSGRELDSQIDPTLAMCNSSCVYVLAGGAVRVVPPWVKLGIHDVGFLSENRLPRASIVEQGKRELHERIAEYLREMGIDKGLFSAASAVPFASVRPVERDELVHWGRSKRIWRNALAIHRQADPSHGEGVFCSH